VAESDAGIGETVPWETVLAEALARVPHGDQLDRLIESDPAVMLGKPVIRGTRITVELILRKLEGRCTDLPGQPESPIRDDKSKPT